MTIRSFFDQLGNKVSVNYPPERIVSLVPSQTELLADLGLERKVVGITKFCVHPAHWLTTKTVIGGTKNFQFDVIDDLKPDLVIGNKEENYLEGIARLKLKYPVWLSNIVTLPDVYSMISSLGEMTATQTKARYLEDEISRRLKLVRKKAGHSVIYFIWRNPWMAAGSGTFINAILSMLNLTNALGGVSRYPEISPLQIADLRPDLIFLASEPYPFREKHIDELKKISPSSRVMLVDGEMFSWYGSRLIKAADYFDTLSL